MSKPPHYFLHGLPGSPNELAYALPDYTACGIKSVPRLDGGKHYADLFENLTQTIQVSGTEHLISFSAGTMNALRLAARLPNQIKQLDLVSAAAPLELGDFLPRMAGKPIFEAARQSGPVLGLLTAAQATMTRLAPNLLIKSIFGNAPQADKTLLSDPSFQDSLKIGLRHSLLEHSHAYKNEIRAYTAPWSDTLHHVKCPVTIWQGTADTWTPFDMALALRDTIAGPVEIVSFNDLAHYSTLNAAMPKIADLRV